MTEEPGTQASGSNGGLTRHYAEAELRGMSDHDLDAAVAAAIDEPEGTSWVGFGRVVGQLHERGYMVHCYARLRLPAQVTVIDIGRRLRLRPGAEFFNVEADTLPRAAAIAAILTCQREQVATALAPAAPPAADARRGPWSEDRRRQQSERMKRFWEQRRAERAADD